MSSFMQRLMQVVIETLTGSKQASPTHAPEPTSASMVKEFLGDVVKRVHQRDVRRQPRAAELCGWLVVLDRGVYLPLPSPRWCCSVHIVEEGEMGEPTSLLERVEKYFEETGNIPTTTCLLYAAQDPAQVTELREVQRVYPDLPVVVITTATDPRTVADLRALHESLTSLVGLVVLPDVPSFIQKVIPHL